MSGSFHLSLFVFCQFWRRSYKNQLSLSGKDSTADFFIFRHFDQNTKNENCNELDIFHSHSTHLLAATTLRNVLGTKHLAEILSERETISHVMEQTLDEATDPWGVKVERVEM